MTLVCPPTLWRRRKGVDVFCGILMPHALTAVATLCGLPAH